MQNLDRLVKEQRSLARKVSLKNGFSNIKAIAGADSAFSKGRVFTSVVACEYPSLKPVESITHSEMESFPYIPGFLSYREAPSIEKAFRKLKAKLDVVLVDGQGICHPRGIGLASHLGIILNVPTIGVAKSRLCGDIKRGRILLKGKHIGWTLETKPGTRPLFISPGHKVSIKSSLEIVKNCIKNHKLPEPLRFAHLYSRNKRIG
jgi:deoxyribonuclease V